jgi:hypothetical protein
MIINSCHQGFSTIRTHLHSRLINGADAKKKSSEKEKSKMQRGVHFVYIAHDARKVKVVQSAYTSARDTFTFGVQHTLLRGSRSRSPLSCYKRQVA